jgi:hypothetical protein
MPSINEQLDKVEQMIRDIRAQSITEANERTATPKADVAALDPELDEQQVLKALDDWAAANSYSGSMKVKRLWLILSALRGPDNLDGKQEATTYIRAAALPKMADAVNYTAHYKRPETEKLQQLTQYRRPDDNSDHFANHIRMAAEALLGHDL